MSRFIQREERVKTAEGEFVVRSIDRNNNIVELFDPSSGELKKMTGPAMRRQISDGSMRQTLADQTALRNILVLGFEKGKIPMLVRAVLVLVKIEANDVTTLPGNVGNEKIGLDGDGCGFIHSSGNRCLRSSRNGRVQARRWLRCRRLGGAGRRGRYSLWLIVFLPGIPKHDQ